MLREPREDLHNLLGDIDELVERWNRKHEVTIGAPLEGYLKGDVDFLFEYAGRGDTVYYPVIQAKRLDVPRDISPILAATDVAVIGHARAKVWNLPSDFASPNGDKVAYGNQRRMLSWVVDGAHEIKKLVPSRFTVGFETDYSREKLRTNLVGQSVTAGFLKPCSGFREWELDSPLFSGRGCEGADNVSICMVKSVSQVLDCITATKRKAIYHGFVAFGEGGSLSGLCVSLKNVSEGSIFRENFVNIRDVFRGPINLEARRLEQIVCSHGEEPPADEAEAP